MCDYSLHGVTSRKARQGDTLTTHNFGTGTRGFRDSGDTKSGKEATAVCILPGTELAFDRPVRIMSDTPLGKTVFNGVERLVGQRPKLFTRMATFIQINTNQPDTHHDALEFVDGAIMLINYLVPGQYASVLALPAPPKTKAEARAQERVTFTG